MAQGDLHLQLKSMELELWRVELLKVKASLPVGQAIYIIWSDEDKQGKNKPHPFQGDVRIVRKLRSETKKQFSCSKMGEQ
jgi:hypothetical protein